jgi:hypothetical protein
LTANMTASVEIASLRQHCLCLGELLTHMKTAGKKLVYHTLQDAPSASSDDFAEMDR